jgi:hypothetical protein
VVVELEEKTNYQWPLHATQDWRACCQTLEWTMAVVVIAEVVPRQIIDVPDTYVSILVVVVVVVVVVPVVVVVAVAAEGVRLDWYCYYSYLYLYS